MADVAQLAEHLVVAQVAVGSNPIIRPTNFEGLQEIVSSFFWLFTKEGIATFLYIFLICRHFV